MLWSSVTDRPPGGRWRCSSRSKEHYKQNREKILKQQREYRERNREKIRGEWRERQRKHYRGNRQEICRRKRDLYALRKEEARCCKCGDVTVTETLCWNCASKRTVYGF